MIRIASVLLVLLAPAAHAAEPAEAEQRSQSDGITDPEPLGNPGEWVTSRDYPPGALREDLEGVTRFKLIVGVDGRVTGCQVTTRSGSDELDEATCALISQRATFSPARDTEGVPVEGTWSSAVRWEIPRYASRPEPMSIVISYVVKANGVVTDCTVERTEGLEELAVDNLKDACPAGLSEPFTDDEGNPVKRRVRVTHSVVVEPM
jgi:protein TonB